MLIFPHFPHRKQNDYHKDHGYCEIDQEAKQPTHPEIFIVTPHNTRKIPMLINVVRADDLLSQLYFISAHRI
jgi:hypothetical protein